MKKIKGTDEAWESRELGADEEFATPIDILFDKADMKCTLCDKPMGTCDCWTKCSCGWSYEKGTECRNPGCVLNFHHN
jgi:hypothetical protein